MAQFTADLNPKSNAMSLGDMMKMGLYSAESDVLNRQAHVAREQEKEIPVVQSFLNGPDSKDENGDWDLKRVNTVLPSLAPLTGPGYADKINGLVRNTAEATKARLNLSHEARTQIASLYGAYADAKVDDPQVVAQGMMNLGQEVPELVPYITPILRNMEHAEKGPKFLESLYVARNKVLSPTEGISAYGAKGSIANIAGADRPVVTRNSATGGNPTIQPTNFAGPNGSVAQPIDELAPKTDTRLPKLIQEDASLNYVPNTSGIRTLDKYQDKAYETGDKKIEKANAVMTEQKDLQQAVRQVENYAGSATGAKGVQMVQSGLKWVFGNSDLDSLVKNMAQVQARNAEVMGLTQNVQMGELNSKLSGNEKIDEKALSGVMQQVLANSKAAELYVNGLNKFVEKRGDINGKIQQQKFENKWKEHYDQRIFQVDNIAASNAPENIKQDKIDQITGQMSPKEYDKYIKDRDVIHRLSKGAYQ